MHNEYIHYTMNKLIYIVYHFIISTLMTIGSTAIRLDLTGMLTYFYFTSY